MKNLSQHYRDNEACFDLYFQCLFIPEMVKVGLQGFLKYKVA